MTESFASLEGYRVLSASIHLPRAGVWWADVVLDTDPELSGAATLTVGSRSFVGTIDPGHNQTFGLRRHLRLIGGAGGWSSSLPARAYHNDAQVKARDVLDDLAREAGESFSTALPVTPLGVDYVRRAGLASATLEDIVGTDWWVELDGRTAFGDRTGEEVDPGAYVVTSAKPDEGLYTLGLLDDDVGLILPGATLSGGLDAPVTAADVRIDVSPEDVEVAVWAPLVAATEGRGVQSLRAIVSRIQGERIYGLIRYRVAEVSGDRVKLQAISAGYPTIGPVDMVPGVAGASAGLVLGSELLVQFVEGDPRRPVVTHFAEKGGPGHEPDTLTIAVGTTLKLGSASASDGVALSSGTNSALDAIAAGLDALATTTIIPNDGGAALKAALVAAWTAPTPAHSVGSTKVFAE